MNHEEEVISMAATEAGVSVVTQRGAVIGLELLLRDADEVTLYHPPL